MEEVVRVFVSFIHDENKGKRRHQFFERVLVYWSFTISVLHSGPSDSDLRHVMGVVVTENSTLDSCLKNHHKYY